MKFKFLECLTGYFPVSTNETDEYSTCMAITKRVIANEEAKMTWGIVGLSVLLFMIIFIGCLYCIHRRNVRQMQKRAKMTTKGRGVIKVVQSNPNSNESTNNSPEKLLIKSADV